MAEHDDDRITYMRRTKLLHYGSLEERERERLEVDPNRDAAAELINKGIAAGHINISNDPELRKLPIDPSTDLKLQFERRKKARAIQITTNDEEIKSQLRKLGEPICLFGEAPPDRRERYRMIIADRGEDPLKRKIEDEEHEDKQRIKKKGDEMNKETWYHEGPAGLRRSRIWIVRYSLPRAAARLEKARQDAQLSVAAKNSRIQELHKNLRSMSIDSSQIGDSRPVSFCRFSPNGEVLATGSWSGLCKLWAVSDCEEIAVLRGHNINVGAIVFHPEATLSRETSAVCMASCSADGAVKLWSLDSEEPIADIEGHAPHRVAHLEFHPSGRFLGTCCHDNSWRLWDLEMQEEVLHQEGHSRPVKCLAFQTDGSLVISGGLDAFGRVWDMRTGRCIMFMDGHLKSILSLDIHSNGYHIVTGSEDNTAKIWDLRQRKSLYTIPAHTNLVSTVKFQPNGGNYLLTASFDKTVKLWSHPIWAPITTLSGHEGKVLSADISPDNVVATASFDRTFKLWKINT